MSLQIRAFRNTDVQPLCRVLKAHFAAIGLSSSVIPLTLELCVLAKPYFQPECLTVAEVDGQVAGFLLMGFEPDSQLQSVSTSGAVISCLCVAPSPEEQTVASELLDASLKKLRAFGASHVQYSPPPPATPFMAGLLPGEGMIGLPEIDPRQLAWFNNAQWHTGIGMSSWELELGRFQPPMDRTQIQIRRMAHVDRLLDEPLLPWYIASVLGHTEPVGFQLTNRQDKRVAAEVFFWMIGRELLPQPDVVAHLWPALISSEEQQEDKLVFLLSEALRQLRDDRVDIVRTVTPSSNAAVIQLLSRLGFIQTATGNVLSRDL